MARTFVAASSQYLEKASAVLTATPITIAAWFRPASASGNHTIAGLFNNGGTTNYFELIQSANQLLAIASDTPTGAVIATSTGTVSASTWTHGAAVFGSSTSRDVYQDGGNKGSNTTSVTPSGINTTAIGRRSLSTPTNYFGGDIAEAGMWNVALDAAEIAALGAGVSPLAIRRTALVAYWPLVGNYSPEIDPVGRNELTVTGATAIAHPRIYLPSDPLFVPKTPVIYHIAGVTKNAAGSAVGSATVKLFRTSDDVLIGSSTSDGSGNYSFSVGNNTTQYYIVAYKAGSPDISGTTVNTLVGA